jgi:hypothetical protein
MNPHLVLYPIAAGRVVLGERVQACPGEPIRGGVDLVGGVDLDTEVIHHGGLSGLPFQAHEACFLFDLINIE